MDVVVLDLETFFTDTSDEWGIPYTLSKRSTESYIRHPWFEAHGAAIKWSPSVPARWYSTAGQNELEYQLVKHDWDNTILIAWHAQFDGLILSHRYNVHPARIICPMSMFRLLYGVARSASLDNVRKFFNMPPKTTPYNLFKGKHWYEMDQATQDQVAAGAEDEVESIWTLFGMLMKEFPQEEIEVLDHTIKMFTEPMLQADTALLAQIWEREEVAKVAHRTALNVAETDLQSADKFSKLLEAEGIEIETKNGKKGPIPCFAKTDDFMRGLLEHDNPRVRTLAEARLGEKSTFMQTRAETLGWTASRGALPVYLNYAGAGTLRVSGGDKCLVADTVVPVFDPEKGLTDKRLVDILPDDLVWDGIAFVAHGGVAFRGYKEVIEWDGIIGTPDHIVFTSTGEITLAQAAETKTPIMDCCQPPDRILESSA